MKKAIVLFLTILLISFTFSNYTYAEQIVDAKYANADRTLRVKFSDGDKIEDKVAVAYFVDKNVIGGIEEGSRLFFKSDVILTRAQAAKIFALGLNLPEVSTIQFSDTKNHWGLADIQKVAAAKLMTGTTATTFSPDKQFTNAEIAVVLSRAISITETEDLSSIKDIDKKHWAYNAFSKLVAANIITPVDGKLNPDALVNREQFASMFYKGLQYANKIEKTDFSAIASSTLSVHSIRDYSDKREVIAYEIPLSQFENIVPPAKVRVKITYGDKVKHWIGGAPKSAMEDLQFFFIFLSDYGVQLKPIMDNVNNRLLIIPPDPTKKIKVEPITAEMALEDAQYEKYITTEEVQTYVKKLMPSEIDFMRDGKLMEISGKGKKQFTIEYNGKIDTITLNKLYLNEIELFEEINKQTVNTKVRVETLYPNYASKYAHFVAPDFVEGATIIVKGAEDIFGEMKVSPASNQ